jgi:hypothetical protein
LSSREEWCEEETVYDDEEESIGITVPVEWGERFGVIVHNQVLKWKGGIKKALKPRIHENQIIQARQVLRRLDFDAPKRTCQRAINMLRRIVA